MSKYQRQMNDGQGRAAQTIDERKQASRRLRLIVVGILILGAAGGLTALGLSMPDKLLPQSPAATQPTTPDPYEYNPVTDKHWHPGHGHWHDGPPPALTAQTGDGVAAPPGVTNPSPWQYDAATDRHYDPGHGHWHSGPPPAGVDENTLVSPVRTDRVDAPPGIFNPQPWQYDAASDRHFDPGHQHWHSGPPPDPSQR